MSIGLTPTTIAPLLSIFAEYVEFGAFITLLGVGVMYFWLKKREALRYIKDTPSQKIRSAAVGRGEIHGTVTATDATLDQPIRDDRCVYTFGRVEEKREIRFEHEEKNRTTTKTEWATIDRHEEVVPFYIDDGTGKILVDTTDEPYCNISNTHTATTELKPGEEPPDGFADEYKTVADPDTDTTSVSSLRRTPKPDSDTEAGVEDENEGNYDILRSLQGFVSAASGKDDEYSVGEVKELGGYGEPGGLVSDWQILDTAKRKIRAVSKRTSKNNYDRKGPVETGAENCPRRYYQKTLPIGADVYGFGEIEPRTGEATADTDRFKLTRDPSSGKFIISDGDEGSTLKQMAGQSRILLYLTLFLIGSGFFFMFFYSG